VPPALWLIALPISGVPVVYVLRRVGWGDIEVRWSLWFRLAAAQLPNGVLGPARRSINRSSPPNYMLALFVTYGLLFDPGLCSSAEGKSRPAPGV
jgi:hypothetical protein